MRTDPPVSRTSRSTAVGYLRRSTDRQEQSIPDQRAALERYAAEHELTIARFTAARKCVASITLDSEARTAVPTLYRVPGGSLRGGCDGRTISIPRSSEHRTIPDAVLDGAQSP